MARSFLLCTLVTISTLSAQSTDSLRSATWRSLFPCGRDTLIVSHRFYSLSYVPHHGQAEWVAYTLADSMITGRTPRRDRFRSDPDAFAGSVRPSDYRGSGFDKGHLCPAADMSWDSLAMEETFFMSNMSPQVPAFNRGVWKELEERVRGWIDRLKRLFIITGPVLEDGLDAIGKRTRISVPKEFYKIVYRATDSTQQAVAFLLANAPSNQPLSLYMVTIDSLEHRTGIDFFPMLEDSIENSLESRTDTTWFPIPE